MRKKFRRMVLAIGWVMASAMLSAVYADESSHGKVVYDHACAPCHNPGNWAAFKLTQRNGEKLALLEQRTDLSSALVITAIRSGIGNMPPYRLTEVSNADAQAVADYLTHKR